MSESGHCCKNLHTYTYIHASIHTHTRVCVCVCVCVCLCARLWGAIAYMYVHWCKTLHTSTYIHASIHTHVCVCVCVCVCVRDPVRKEHIKAQQLSSPQKITDVFSDTDTYAQIYSERKERIKSLRLRWHPDKNPVLQVCMYLLCVCMSNH